MAVFLSEGGDKTAFFPGRGVVDGKNCGHKVNVSTILLFDETQQQHSLRELSVQFQPRQAGQGSAWTAIVAVTMTTTIEIIAQRNMYKQPNNLSPSD